MPIIDDTQETDYSSFYPPVKPASQVQEDNVIHRSEYINSSPEEYSMSDFRNNVSYRGYKPLDLGEKVLDGFIEERTGIVPNTSWKKKYIGKSF